MRAKAGHHGGGNRRRAAFSLIELMLAISIMGIITYALYSVFNHTQRALRSSQVQGDVSEKARAIMEMVSRELEQAHPTMAAAPVTNAYGWLHEVNLSAGPEWMPRVQKSSRADVQSRTNTLYDLFFLNRSSNLWTGIGYRVTNVLNGVGVLVRYELPFTHSINRIPQHNVLLTAFQNERPGSTNYHHVADGVIHFKLSAYDADGAKYQWDSTNLHSTNYYVMKAGLRAWDGQHDDQATVRLSEGIPNFPQETRFLFSSNAMPAYLELELAILEPEALRQFYTMIEDENPNATNFLSRQIDRVHLFRQRIPIRTAVQ